MKITKAVILTGGLGTRMEPITKVLAKEMLPIVDKPVLSYLIKSLIKSNIREVLVVSHKEKVEIQNYFENDCINFMYVFPNKPNGVVDALKHAKSFVGDEPFVLLFGDVLPSNKNHIKDMVNLFEKTNKSVASLMEVEEDKKSFYGIVEHKNKNGLLYIYNIIEKPKLKQTESNMALSGQYVLNSEIFFEMEKMGENRLFTDALLSLSKQNKLLMKKASGYVFDVGSKSGFLKANIFYGLKHQKTQKDVKKFLNIIYENGLKMPKI